MNTNKAKIMLKEVMDKTGYNLTRLASEIPNVTGESTSVQNLSNKINRGTIKFSEMEQLLNIMGYQLDFKENMLIDVASVLYPILIYNLDQQDMMQVLSLLKNNNVPTKLKMDLRNKIFHGNRDNFRQYIIEFVLDASNSLSIDQYF